MNNRGNKERKLRYRHLFWALALFGAAVLLLIVNAGAIQRSFYPLKYQSYVEKAAAANGVDPLLVNAVIRTESAFNPAAVSDVGARGLMQITEETFAWIKLKSAPGSNVTFQDMFDPETNIKFGTFYLAKCLERYADVPTAIAAYHSGWGKVDELLKDSVNSQAPKTLSRFPYPQMEHYVQKVQSAYIQYQKLYN